MTDNQYQHAKNFLCAALGRYGDSDGLDYLETWIEDRASFSYDVFKAVVGEFEDELEAAKRDGRTKRRPTIRAITRAYERRMANTQRQDAFDAGNDCGHCDGSGAVHIVIAGDCPFSAKPVPSSRFMAGDAHAYAVHSLAPCTCNAGRLFKGRGDWPDSVVSRIVSDFAASPLLCDRVAYQMRGDWRVGLGRSTRTDMANKVDGTRYPVYTPVGGVDADAMPIPATPREARAEAATAVAPRYREDDAALVASDSNDGWL